MAKKLYTEEIMTENYGNFMAIVNYLDDCDKEKFTESYREKFHDVRFKLAPTETYKNAVIYVVRNTQPAKRGTINVALWCKPIRTEVLTDLAGREGYTVKTKENGYMIISANIKVDNQMPENVAEVFTVLRNA